MPKNKPDYLIRLRASEHVQEVHLKESGYYRVELLDAGIEVTILGGWHLKNKDAVSIMLDIVHKAPHTRSNTTLRAVAEDSSNISLTGTIIVEPKAQDTNAFLTENILLLSDSAHAEAVPNLEIEANEVKCSHAATITNIDEEHLFYCASRGIPEAKAKQIIVDGFLANMHSKNSPTSQAETQL